MHTRKGTGPNPAVFLQSAPGRAFLFPKSGGMVTKEKRKEQLLKSKIWFALITLYIVWGSTYLAIRVAGETIPPFLMAGTRFLLSGLILFIWRRAAGDPLPTLSQWRSALIIGLLLLMAGNGVLSWAEQRVPSGLASLIIATIPLWMVILNWLIGQGPRPDARVAIGLMVGFAGVLYLFSGSGSSTAVDSAFFIGFGACLLAAITWSFGSIYSHRADKPKSVLMGTGIEMLGGALGLFIAGLLAGEWQQLDIAHIKPESITGLVYLVLVGSLVGFVSYAWLLRNAPISLVATYAYVNPVVAIALGAWLGQESVGNGMAVASAGILGSVILISSSKQASTEQFAEPAPVGD